MGGLLIALTTLPPQGADPLQLDSPCSSELLLALRSGSLCCHRISCVQCVWQKGSRLEEDAPCRLSQDAVTGLVDGDAFQGGPVRPGCCAALASSWRVLNPWEILAGSNKHKHCNKPELKKLYLCHCLRRSQSCLWHVFLFPVLWGTQEAEGASSFWQ